MFLEKRKSGKKTKYYITHSYRDEEGKVQKIRRYLGSNLSEKEIEKLQKKAEEHIRKQIEELKTDVFDFSLTEKEIEKLNEYSEKIEIRHLDKKDWQLFTENFVYNTNAIEGSTVLRDEVHDILKKKKAEDPEEIETKGVAKAVEFLRKTQEGLSLSLIKKLHKLCFEGSKSFAGSFRKEEVVIRNAVGDIIHRGIPARELQASLEDFIDWYKNNRKKFKPLVLAAIIHNQFEYIHPFRDGNGRVGRLLLNFVLLKNNYPPINIILEDRQDYYRTLRTYASEQKLEPTLKFLIKQYEKTLEKVTTEKENK